MPGGKGVQEVRVCQGVKGCQEVAEGARGCQMCQCVPMSTKGAREHHTMVPGSARGYQGVT